VDAKHGSCHVERCGNASCAPFDTQKRISAKTDSGQTQGNAENEEAVSAGWMQKILDSHPSITLLVSLNTYPYKLPADFGENYEDYLPTVDWETVLAEMPASWK
jgi:hypothetical protein